MLTERLGTLMVVRIYYIPQSAPIRVRGFESLSYHKYKRLPINQVVERVTDVQRLRILQVFHQGFLGLFEMNKSWIYGGVVECRHSRLRIWCQ